MPLTGAEIIMQLLAEEAEHERTRPRMTEAQRIKLMAEDPQQYAIMMERQRQEEEFRIAFRRRHILRLAGIVR